MNDPVSHDPRAFPWTAICIGEAGAAHLRSEIEQIGLQLSKALLTSQVLGGGCYSALVPWGSKWGAISAPRFGGVGRAGLSAVSARAPADRLIAEYLARVGHGGSVIVEDSLEKRADREPSEWGSECAFHDADVYRSPHTHDAAAILDAILESEGPGACLISLATNRAWEAGRTWTDRDLPQIAADVLAAAVQAYDGSGWVVWSKTSRALCVCEGLRT